MEGVSGLVKGEHHTATPSPTAIELLLQGSQLVESDDQGLDCGGDNALSIAEQPMDISHEATGEEAVSIQEITNLAGVDIINLPNQPMFQLVSDADGSSYMQLTDTSSMVQAVPNGEGTLQTVTLPSSVAALLQQNHSTKQEPSLEGQAVQLDDGIAAIVHNIQPAKDSSLEEPGMHLGNDSSSAILRKEASAARLLEGQVIQLEDGTTGFIQASLSGGDVQSVQLEDGSTAYISLFGDPGGGALSIDSNPPQDLHTPLQVISGDDSNGPQQMAAPDGELGTLANIKEEHSMNSNSSVMDDSDSISISEDGELTSTNILMRQCGPFQSNSSQPHVSFRALALGEKAYKCDFENCGRLYTTQHHLKVHGRSHTGDKPFKCEFPGCGKAFATGYGLKSHTRVHTGEKPYRCTDAMCNKAFKTSGDLQKHIRTHTGERPFKCPFEGCERMFTTSNIRKVHIRTHTGERPYVCREDGCSKSFASATNYKNHIRIHTGEKPYVCTVEGCGKRFTEYSSLYKHHVVHTQSKPYICNHCHKTYRQTSTLAMHKRTIHNDHEGNLEGDALLSTIQLVNPVAAGSSERDGDTEGALVINTSDAGLPIVGGGGGRSGLATIQTHSSALLQHLQPSGISLQDIQTMQEAGIQQVYLIADPTQIETLKQMATQQPSGEPGSEKQGLTLESGATSTHQPSTSGATLISHVDMNHAGPEPSEEPTLISL